MAEISPVLFAHGGIFCTPGAFSSCSLRQKRRSRLKLLFRMISKRFEMAHLAELFADEKQYDAGDESDYHEDVEELRK